MSELYTKAQGDAQAAIIGNRIKTATEAANIVAKVESVPDKNLITDAERTAISNIESPKFKGQYADLTALSAAHPTGVPGEYATLTKPGDDTNAIWDDGANQWVDTEVSVTAETAATVKSKYESNANTNAFTDAHLTKLNDISEASNITAFTAALDAALL